MTATPIPFKAASLRGLRQGVVPLCLSIAIHRIVPPTLASFRESSRLLAARATEEPCDAAVAVGYRYASGGEQCGRHAFKGTLAPIGSLLKCFFGFPGNVPSLFPVTLQRRFMSRTDDPIVISVVGRRMNTWGCHLL